MSLNQLLGYNDCGIKTEQAFAIYYCTKNCEYKTYYKVPWEELKRAPLGYVWKVNTKKTGPIKHSNRVQLIYKGEHEYALIVSEEDNDGNTIYYYNGDRMANIIYLQSIDMKYPTIQNYVHIVSECEEHDFPVKIYCTLKDDSVKTHEISWEEVHSLNIGDKVWAGDMDENVKMVDCATVIYKDEYGASLLLECTHTDHSKSSTEPMVVYYQFYSGEE